MLRRLLLPLLALLSLPAQASEDIGTAYQFSFRNIDGGELKLASYEGKILLVVNTASLCGFTKQYTGLEELYSRYKDRGLVVLGVPSNDFGGQEPGNEGEIKEFCELTYGINFPLAAKEVVSGEQAHPFYKWAGQQAGMLGRPKWNFHKYLIGPDGRYVSWFATTTKPLDPAITTAIEKLLPAAKTLDRSGE